MASEEQEYQKWIEKRGNLIDALEKFKLSVRENERDLTDELEEAHAEAGIMVMITED
jgi:hypothetical protein